MKYFQPIAIATIAAIFAGILLGCTLVSEPQRDIDKETMPEAALRTWRSFEWMVYPETGLPADNVRIDPKTKERTRSVHTSPTNIGAFIWSTIAAKDLNFITKKAATEYLDPLLRTLGRMERHHGFYLNWYDASSGNVLTEFPEDKTVIDQFLSTVDNAWLAVGLMILRETMPQYKDRANTILQDMNFRFFYDPAVGQMRGGYHMGTPNTNIPTAKFTDHHYGALNTEPRIASYIGIANGQIPEEHYYKLWRTFPKDWTWPELIPQGDWTEYKGTRTFQGVYVRPGRENAPLVPSWGGSMFEALMVPLFVPESDWGPKSWKINHERYVAAQIDHGLTEAGYGYWGFSPSKEPGADYREYGVDWLGMDSNGYTSDQEETTVDYKADPPVVPTASSYGEGVVTPHAVFLALGIDFLAATANLEKLKDNFDIYGDGGYYDALNIKTGEVAYYHLALDQGMIMAALANYLLDDTLMKYFSSQIETKIRPLLAVEDFFSEIGQNQ